MNDPDQQFADRILAELTAANARIADYLDTLKAIYNKLGIQEGAVDAKMLVSDTVLKFIEAKDARIAELEEDAKSILNRAQRESKLRNLENSEQVENASGVIGVIGRLSNELAGERTYSSGLRAELARLKAEGEVMEDALKDIDQSPVVRSKLPGAIVREARLKLKRMRGEVEIPGQEDFLTPPAPDGKEPQQIIK